MVCRFTGMDIAWTIVTVLVPLLVGAAMSLVGWTPPEFRVARWCFILAALILGGMSTVWQVWTDQPLWCRITVGALVGTLIGAGLPEALRWITRRENFVKSDNTIKESLPPEILYEDKPPYNHHIYDYDKSSKEIGRRRYICIGVRNNGSQVIEGVSVQMVSGIGGIESQALLPQTMRVRNRPGPVFDIPPGDTAIVEVVRKQVVWDGSGKEWINAGLDLAFAEGLHKMPSGGYIFKLQILGRNIPPQYIWLSVSDWYGKAQWKVERVSEGTQIRHMDGSIEIVSLHG